MCIYIYELIMVLCWPSLLFLGGVVIAASGFFEPVAGNLDDDVNEVYLWHGTSVRRGLM